MFGSTSHKNTDELRLVLWFHQRESIAFPPWRNVCNPNINITSIRLSTELGLLCRGCVNDPFYGNVKPVGGLKDMTSFCGESSPESRIPYSIKYSAESRIFPGLI